MARFRGAQTDGGESAVTVAPSMGGDHSHDGYGWQSYAVTVQAGADRFERIVDHTPLVDSPALEDFLEQLAESTLDSKNDIANWRAACYGLDLSANATDGVRGQGSVVLTLVLYDPASGERLGVNIDIGADELKRVALELRDERRAMEQATS